MKIYTTEEEQVAALRAWFKNYGVIALLSLAVIIGLVFGWQLWQDSKAKYVESASILFEQMQNAQQQEEINAVAIELNNNYKDTIYGKVASLILTNQKAKDKKWSDVVSEYKALYIELAQWPDLQVIVFENWIRTQVELNKTDTALKELMNNEKESEFAKLYPLNFYNLKGDILAKLNKNAEAVQAYNKAIDSANMNPQLQQQAAQFVNWIVLKRNDLLDPKPLA